MKQAIHPVHDLVVFRDRSADSEGRVEKFNRRHGATSSGQGGGDQ